MIVLDDSNIDKIMSHKGTQLILFYSENIPTLDGIISIFEGFESQLKGKVDVYTCEIEKQKRTGEYFQMNTLPAVLFLRDGNVYGNIAGPSSKAKYESLVKDGLVQMIEDDKAKKEKNPNVLDVDEMYGY